MSCTRGSNSYGALPVFWSVWRTVPKLKLAFRRLVAELVRRPTPVEGEVEDRGMEMKSNRCEMAFNPPENMIPVVLLWE